MEITERKGWFIRANGVTIEKQVQISRKMLF
jgi:hypothetical protein